MPTLHTLYPSAGLPLGEIEVKGADLGPQLGATVAGVPALVTLARPGRAIIRIPEGSLPGEVTLSRDEAVSNGLRLSVAVAMAENLHPVANPAVDVYGNVYTTLSGSRGQQTPVSVFRIAPAPEGVVHELRPFVRDILNPSGLAFGPDGLLYVSSRAEGIVYQVGHTGTARVFAEGLGIATGLAFDRAGALYVGDRSGTIFKIPATTGTTDPANTFVFATLEPSISAYHLAFNSVGTLFVSGPTTASSQVIHAIAPDGTASVFFSGLGRAQGLTCDAQDNVYIAASLGGERGIFRLTPSTGGEPQATLMVAGSNLVGLCLLPDERAALATRDAIYEVQLRTA